MEARFEKDPAPQLLNSNLGSDMEDCVNIGDVDDGKPGEKFRQNFHHASASTETVSLYFSKQ